MKKASATAIAHLNQRRRPEICALVYPVEQVVDAIDHCDPGGVSPRAIRAVKGSFDGSVEASDASGEVEAEIIELYANAIKETGDFYNFQRTLEVYEQALDSDTRLILTTDSDLFRMLKQVTPDENKAGAE